MSRFLIVMMLAVTCSCSAGELRFHSDLGESDRQIGSIAFESVRASRERLITGSYVATGRTVRTEGDVERYSGEVEWKSTFDYSTDHLLFFRREPTLLTADEDGSGRSLTTRWGVLDARTIFRPDVMYDWNDLISTQVGIYSRDPDRIPLSAPVDIQLLGLGTLPELSHSRGLNDVLNGFGYLELVDVQEDQRIVKLTFAVDAEGLFTVERVLVLDKTMDYVPVSYVIQHRRPPSDTSNTETLVVVYNTECTWKKSANVYVPDSAILSNQVAEGAEIIYQMAFSWATVNEPVAADRFEIDQLQLGGFAKVYDFRGPTPTQVMDLRPPVVSRSGKTNGAIEQRGGWILILLNAIVLLVLIVTWTVRQRATRRSRSAQKASHE